MKLRDLSKYSFMLLDDGSLSIIDESDKPVKMQGGKAHTPCYRLTTDTGVTRTVSKGMIVYLMKNPEFSILDIHPLEQRIRFTDDGEVIGLYDWSRRKPQFNKFRDFDDVMMTVMYMKCAINGNMQPIYQFLIDSRDNAIGTVARLVKKGYGTIEPFASEGELQFLKELRHANVQRICPLFVWLCKCIKYAYKQGVAKKVLTVPFDKVENKIPSDETGI